MVEKLDENKTEETGNSEKVESINDSLDIPIVDSGGFDPTPFEGQKFKIEVVNIEERRNLYPGGVYDADSKEMRPAVRVETETITTITDSDGTDKKITVNALFNLQERYNKAGEKEVVISKNPNAKLWKFMRKIGATTLKEIKGKIVTLTTEPSSDPEDDRKFLRILI